MGELNNVMNEIKADVGESTPADTTTSQGGASTETNTAPGTASAGAETGGDGEPSATKHAPKKGGKKDLSGISKEEKAAYAFRKMMEKREKKQMDSFNAMLDERLKDFKQPEVPKAPEPKKGRKDFKTDEEYLDYLVEQRVAGIMKGRDEDAARKAEEAEKAEAAKRQEMEANQRAMQAFSTNIQAAYQGEELEAWKERVAKAAKKGLGEILEASPILKRFVMQSRLGPVLLDRIITDPDSLRRLARPFSSPVEYEYELLRIANEAEAERTGAAQQPKKPTPHIGRPGAGADTAGGNRTMFDNDDALIKFMRKGRRR